MKYLPVTDVVILMLSRAPIGAQNGLCEMKFALAYRKLSGLDYVYPDETDHLKRRENSVIRTYLSEFSLVKCITNDPLWFRQGRKAVESKTLSANTSDITTASRDLPKSHAIHNCNHIPFLSRKLAALSNATSPIKQLSGHVKAGAN